MPARERVRRLTTGVMRERAKDETLVTQLRRKPYEDCAWQSVREAITRLLSDQGVRHVAVERAEEGPQRTSAGKFREVVPLTE